MAFALRPFVVWGVSPTTPVLRSNIAKDGGGSATCFTGRNRRLLRRADTLLALLESHAV